MKILRVLFAGALFSLSLFAADVNGTWVGVVKIGNAQQLPFVVHIKQAGDKITGKMDGINLAPDVEIVDGQVNGDTVTYKGVRKINNADVTFNYTATLSGDTLTFKIVRADGAGMPLSSETKKLTSTE